MLAVENEESVEDILKVFEKEGLVFKTWDIKKQDYEWHRTEFGQQVYDKMKKDKQLWP